MAAPSVARAAPSVATDTSRAQDQLRVHLQQRAHVARPRRRRAAVAAPPSSRAVAGEPAAASFAAASRSDAAVAVPESSGWPSRAVVTRSC